MREDTPRTYSLRFTPRAAADIDAAHARFAELSSEELADEWKAGLFEAVTPLSTLPHRQIAPEMPAFGKRSDSLSTEGAQVPSLIAFCLPL